MEIVKTDYENKKELKLIQCFNIRAVILSK